MSGFEFNRHFDGRRSAGWPFAVAAVVAAPVSVVAMPLLGWAARAFDVTITNYMSPGWYFAAVYAASFAATGLATTLLPSERARRAEKIPLTVRDLVEAARRRRWSVGQPEGASHG